MEICHELLFKDRRGHKLRNVSELVSRNWEKLNTLPHFEFICVNLCEISDFQS